tara:strand:- start:2021 stop:2470 length:450 start_codon:yes stop_codon:yes gene_type:complete
MKQFKVCKASLFVFGLSISAWSHCQIEAQNNSIIVVANINESGLTLTKQQVKSLFMGSSLGYNFNVATLPPSSLVRVTFNTQVIGLTEDRIQSFWAQMRFTGRKTQPKQIDSLESLLDYVKNTPGAVTYLPSSVVVPENLTVLYKTGAL